MYCNNCGKKIEDNSNFCNNCGEKITNNVNNQEVTNNEVKINVNEDKNVNKLMILSLVVHYLIIFGSWTIYKIADILNNVNMETLGIPIEILIGLSTLFSYGSVIYTRIKYPQNKMGKIVMWIYIVEVILAIIGTILLIAFISSTIISCFEACEGLKN